MLFVIAMAPEAWTSLPTRMPQPDRIVGEGVAVQIQP